MALGLETPWYVGGTHFEAASETLMIRVDFHCGSRFSHPEVSGEHPVYDTRGKRYVVRRMLTQWRANLTRSKVRAMKDVARMIRTHLEGIAAWARTRMSNGFLETLNGLLQAAKRKARGYRRWSTLRAIIFLIAGKLDFRTLNPHAA